MLNLTKIFLCSGIFLGLSACHSEVIMVASGGPNEGRYLLAAGYSRLAEFNSREGCILAQENYAAMYSDAGNWNARTRCIYIGTNDSR